MVPIAVCAIALLLVACGVSAAALDVPLVLHEPSGVPRHDEVVTSGVPLPKGVCTDPTALRLFDPSGNEVPAHFAVATRWWDDGSLKWVHVSLQRSLPAHDTETLFLRQAEPRAEVEALPVEETPKAITVTTGPMRFRVRKQHFDLLDQVWLDESGRGQFDDAHALLADRPRGAHVAEGPRLAWASADGACTVTVEERSLYRVVLRAEGRHRLADGAPLTDFITRLTAYRGQPYVLVSHVLLVRQGEALTDYLTLHNLGLTLPLRLTPEEKGLTYRFGGSDAIHTGRLTEQEAVHLYQYAPDGYAIFPASNAAWTSWRMGAQAEGKGHTPRTGWVDLSDGHRGMAAGVRDFWQMFPKTLTAEASGDVTIGLYPDNDFVPPLIVYPGTARTHEVLLDFHGVPDEARISDLMAAFQEPLVLETPPAWYTRTRVFGKLPPQEITLEDNPFRDVVFPFERRFREAYETILRHREERATQPAIANEYGVINYGDGTHYTEAGTTYWDDNYYDFPHALILQYVRTADRSFLDNARAYGRHLGDVDNACWAPEPERVGGPRVCPAIEHVRAYHEGRAKISDSFNFYKNQSLFELWYLTGDRRFLEAGLLSAGYALRVDGIGFSEPRSVGNVLISLIAAYRATGDQAYLDRGRVFWKRIAEYQDKHEGGFPNTYSFQGGLVLEGFRDWYEATKDPDVPARSRRLADWMMAEYGDPEKGFKDPGGFTALAGFGEVSEQTGDQRYLYFAVRHARYWLRTEYGNRVKDYGMAFRSSPYLLWWLLPRKQ
jgi:hypothetical protein